MYSIEHTDAALLRKIGIWKDEWARDGAFKHSHNRQVHLGTFEGAGLLIRIGVTMSPSPYWHFEIEAADWKKVRLRAGPGRLVDYWPMALAIAEQRLTIEEN